MRLWPLLGGMLVVVGLVWIASPGTAASARMQSREHLQRAEQGADGWLQKQSPSPLATSGLASRSIRGIVRGPHGPVAGVQLRASREVPGESLSVLPCEDDPGVDRDLPSLLCLAPEFVDEWVERRQGDVRVLAQASSVEDGSFVLEGLEAGTYALWAEGPEGAVVLRDVEAGRQGVEVGLGAGVRLSGTVTGEGGGPLPGALVTAIFVAHSRFFEAVSDGAGHYSLGPLPRGDYVLRVSKDGWMASQQRWSRPTPLQEKHIVLDLPRTVSGRVTREGLPVQGAQVRIRAFRQPFRQTLTDATGRFAFAGLSHTNHYQLIAWHEGLGARLETDFLLPRESGAQTFAVRKEVTLELAPAVEVRGRVLGESHEPIAHAMVWLDTLEQDTFFGTWTWTDEEGRYVLGPVKPGPLRFGAHAEGWVHPEEAWTSLPAGTSTRDLVLTHAPLVEGQLVGTDGQPIANAPMRVTSRLKPPGSSTQSGPDGRFRLDVPAPGNYQLQINDKRLLEKSQRQEVSAPARLRVVVELRPTVEGEVVDETGALVPDVEVGLWRDGSMRGEPQVDYMTTDARGRFVLVAPSEGRYQLVAELRDESLVHVVTQGVELGRGQTQVRLRFEPARSVSGQVVDEWGRPIEHAFVSLMPALQPVSTLCEAGGPSSSVSTDAGGRFRFQSVSGRSLFLFASGRDYTWRRRVNGETVEPPHVDAGATDVRLVLVREAKVHGRLVRADGSPITRFSLNNTVQQNASGEFSWPIDSTGTLQLEFSMSELYPGETTMRRSIQVEEGKEQELGKIVFKIP